jgi:beta-lactamase regulating signal transducer with metallopeptidase domain
MTPFIRALDSALLHFVWQGMLVAFLLWTALVALRKRSANARYVTCCAALGLLAVLPVATVWLLYARATAIEGSPIPILAVALTGASVPPQISWLALAQAWMLPAWACGVLLLSIRLMWGCARISVLRRNGDPAEPAVLSTVSLLSERLRVTRPVRVLISSLADGPSVIGWLRPVLLLPAATVLGLSPDQFEAILAHELAHIRRYDYLVNLGQMLIETLLFYHPAVWWVSSRIRRERELCCDDVAVRTCGDPVCYARALAVLERMRVVRGGMIFSAALGAKDGPLMYRIQRLLGTTPQEQPASRLPGIVAICLGLACGVANLNPANAQATLLQPPAPPSAPASLLTAPLLTTPPARRPNVPLQLAQSNQPVPAANPPASVPILPGAVAQSTVTVEVTIDPSGEVSGAHIIRGPAELRHTALQMALDMRFPQTASSTTRQIDLLADPDAVGLRLRLAQTPIERPLSGLEYELFQEERRKYAEQQILTLREQQLQASERGSQQLQEQLVKLEAALRQQDSTQPFPRPGTPLGDIRIFGLSDAARDQLLAQLPIHLHDVLTDGSIGAAIRVARELYPQADVYFGRLPSGEAGFQVRVPSR